MTRIRVLVIDDSAFMRKFISDLINSQPDMEVIGTARDGLEGLEKVRALKPDVVTLDVEMPRLDGLGFLSRLMSENPRPVILISGHDKAGADYTLRALDLGALDFLAKPSGEVSLDFDRVKEDLWQKIRTASRVPCNRLSRRTRTPAFKRAPSAASKGGANLIIIGSSTGGPNALTEVIPCLPADLSASVLVVQHMPAGFTRSMAEHLDRQSALTVREAVEGEALRPGLCLVAPGGFHLQVNRGGTVSLITSPPRHGVRPSIDVTLESAARNWSGRIAVAILTGMGSDGSDGCRLIREKGGTVLAQSEATCVVYGMPWVVIERGLADQILPLQEISLALSRWVDLGDRNDTGVA